MPPRVLAVLIPIVLLVAACSGAAGAPTWTYAPSTSAVAAASPTATAEPTVEPTVASSVAPSPAPSVAPSPAPTPAPTLAPSVAPSITPSAVPSAVPLSGEVQVVMTDAMRFVPEPITVKAGEEVTFVVRNEGLIVHEFFVGSVEEQVDHAAEMAAGGMSHGHDNALSLKAGETGSLTMTFAEAGSLLIGCHEPGHYDAGMKATLTVVD